MRRRIIVTDVSGQPIKGHLSSRFALMFQVDKTGFLIAKVNADK